MGVLRKVIIGAAFLILAASVASAITFAEDSLGPDGAETKESGQWELKYTAQILETEGQGDSIEVELVNRGNMPMELANDGKYNDGVSAGAWDCSVNWAEGVNNVETDHIIMGPGDKKRVTYKLNRSSPLNQYSFLAGYIFYGNSWYMIKIGKTEMAEEYKLNACI